MASMGIWLFAAFGRRADYSIRCRISASPKFVPEAYPKWAMHRSVDPSAESLCVGALLSGGFMPADPHTYD